MQLNEDIFDVYLDELQEYQCTFKQHNEIIKEDYDEFSSEFCDSLFKESQFEKSTFPKLLEENISYKVIPCIQFDYTHILTNTNHTGFVINFWDNPKVVLNDDSEKLSTSIGSLGKIISNSFSKLFKTKAFKEKTDRKTEITLLIYMAKADGVIDNDEKKILSGLIGNLDDFTNSEKKQLFLMLDDDNLPSLTKELVQFSSKDFAQQTIDKIETVANADGTMCKEETELLESIKKLIK